jgi:tetratricopeptide (TPR) repeat protein
VQVLYLYTSEVTFSKVVSMCKVVTEMYHDLLEERDYFGSGIFCTRLEPVHFSDSTQILVNMFGSPELDPFTTDKQDPQVVNLVRAKSAGVVRCIPILAPQSIIFSYHSVAEFKDSLESLNPSRDLYGLDIQISPDVEYSLEDANKMLLYTRTKRVSTLRKAGQSKMSVFEEMESLAHLLQNIEQCDIAEPLLRETLAHRQQELGKKHPDTLTTMENLATALEVQGQFDEAEQLFKEVLEGRRTELGQSHQETMKSITDLSSFLERRGRGEEANALKQFE